MGSSPVTATNRPCRALPAREEGPALRGLVAALARALDHRVARGDLLIVAFSGGPDSTALVLGLASLAPARGWRLLAAHVDHRLDDGSASRATAAERIAATLGVAFRRLTAGDGLAGPRDGREAAARRLRYALLESLRDEVGARWLVTAHHGDDQAETVLLRLAMGSGIAGLAGMSEERDGVLRPLLSLGRHELAATVAEAGLATVADPTNDDLRMLRNRMRRRVLPALGGAPVAKAARALGDGAAALASRVERRVLRLLPELDDGGRARARLATLRSLPPELLPWALALLHRRAGADYPPRATAVAQLREQLASGGDVACDCGGGWRWKSDHDGWLLALREVKSSMPFAYTLSVPGEIEIREAGQTFRLSQQPVAAWMWQGAPGRAALALPVASGGTVTVRSRRAGDRLQPFGLEHGRRLKDVLIDRKVPRERRDRLPLLCVGEQVAWVPGITIHHPFRLASDATVAWVAELWPIERAAPAAEGTIRA